MKPSKLIIESAVEQALLSVHRFRVGSTVFYKGSIVGEGFNIATKTHPKSPHPYGVIDAEFAAVIDAVRGVDGYYGYTPDLLKNCGIYTHRLLKDGSSGLAAPCKFCKKMILLTGIKEEDIFYSDVNK